MTMDNLISVIIVDDNILFCNVLNECLNQCSDMLVKGIANNGVEAINMIRELMPRIVILDLIMPNLDGIGVLEKISQMHLKYRPIFIVLTAIGKDTVIQKAIELGAEYYILKPFDVDVLVSRIRQLYNEKFAVRTGNVSILENGAKEIVKMEGDSLEQVISNLIKNMGVPPNIAGYRYLREAVVLSVQNSHLHNLATKYIYRSIAEKHNTTARKVDRAIKCAVESASKRFQNADNCNCKMTVDFNSKSKLTNAKVITSLVNEARFEMKHSN